MVRVIAGCFAFAAALAGTAAHNPSFIYKFDAANAAGVDGSIHVEYAGEDSSTATITAKLDFYGVDQAAIKAFDGNCTEDVTSYKWHIHTKWNSTLTSDSFKQCSKAATDNHYDPLRACGTASEYIAEPDCKAKSLTYACNPTNYAADPLVCEKGDLSGKFGAFNLGEYAAVSGEWTDEHFPLPSESSPTWSIVLHAVCGSQTPRIACAVIQTVEEDDYDGGSSSEHNQDSKDDYGQDGHQDESDENYGDTQSEVSSESSEHEYGENQTEQQTDDYTDGHEKEQNDENDHEYEHESEVEDEHKLCA
ncbi:uncharacterized protein IUM83_13038 [Phytophthora cinnamomi]|uniref:uncharacterized protein n=1 Tax=Phytophthora cinnamomi TaxID=4785 RepID=UPI003559D7E6|nr:hypothetical protein IUM83_13038 [Phytophthora cinnamomi]